MRVQRFYRLALVLAALFAVGLGAALYAGDLLRRFDLVTVDTRFDLRGERTPPPDVLFVAIDDRTDDILDDQFPLRRKYHADVIDALSEAGAKVIAYDVQFTEESSSVEDDNRLIESVRAADNVVLATSEIGRRGQTRIFGGKEGLEYSRATPSHILLPNDPGGTIRRMNVRERGLAGFPVAAVERYRGRPVEVPDGRGRKPWIDFRGPEGTVRTVSFADVQQGRFDRAAVRGKIVVVGASAVALQDLHRTSVAGEDLMPGPELQANAIDTVLRGFPLREGPAWLDLLLLVLAGAVPPLATLAFGIGRAMALSFAGFAAAAVAIQLAFGDGLIVSVAYPLVAFVLSTVASVVLFGLIAAFQREQVRGTFARFVPESVVGEVLSKADGVRLGGTRREVTLLFSDLRGFTSFSERREPDEVIEILNRYLTEMSDAIMSNGGTLVTYMGDGIMAVFGAPLDQPDHADRAIQAGVDMLARMEGFNAWMREEGHGDGFKMGVGLNSGFVMSGMVGSEKRLEYTTIGDVTNTAARIEGMTKGTPHQLFLSESTELAQQVQRDDLEHVGDFEVRGRQDKITIFTVRGTQAPGEAPAPTPSPLPSPAPATV